MRIQMKTKKADVLVLSALDDVAWLLNLRGSDIQFNPVFFSYAAISNTHVYLFVNEIQVSTAQKTLFSKRKQYNNFCTKKGQICNIFLVIFFEIHIFN